MRWLSSAWLLVHTEKQSVYVYVCTCVFVSRRVRTDFSDSYSLINPTGERAELALCKLRRPQYSDPHCMEGNHSHV